MDKRFSFINDVKVLSIGSSCILEIGDSDRIVPKSRVVALQRDKAIFYEQELNFNDYSIFSEEIPQPTANEQLEMVRENQSPFICVSNIIMNNIVASSIVQLGSTEMIASEARVKNIRHLLREKDRG